MTWDEFKQEVDRQLEEKGRDGSTKVLFIDVEIPSKELSSRSLIVLVNDRDWISIQ